jgi:DNA polymerase III subunit delta
MQFKFTALTQHLQQALSPVYLIYGQEPLLQTQALDALRKAAHEQGYRERKSITVTPQFDWQQLSEETRHLSLFSDKRLLEIHLAGQSPGATGSRALQEYCQANYADLVLLITVNKLDQQQLKSKWVKAIDQIGALLAIYPITTDQLPGFIRQRLQHYDMQATADAIALLAQLTAGNLLATQQEIDKLALLFPAQTLTLELIEQAVTDNSQYNIFQLVDQALLGDLDTTLRMLARLQIQRSEPRLLLWSLIKDIRLLLTLALQQQQGTAWATLVRQHRIWQKRIPVLRAALDRHSATQYANLLQHLIPIDAILKGARAGNAWHELSHVLIKVAQAS